MPATRFEELPHLSCGMCDNAIPKRIGHMVKMPIPFLHNNKLWHVNVPLCINEDCLLARGGTFVEHRTPSRPNTNAY